VDDRLRRDVARENRLECSHGLEHLDRDVFGSVGEREAD
jgi:hypothetical protein